MNKKLENMLNLSKNIEMVEMIDKVKEYIIKTVENLESFTSSEELDNGMIIINGVSKSGKSYEFYYNTECGFFRKIYDGWQNEMKYNLYL